MAMPPQELSPEELWNKLNECPRPSEVVDFPRRDSMGRPLTKIRIQVLTQMEHTKARMEARSKVMQAYEVKSADLDDPVMREIVSEYAAKEALKLACLAVNSAGDRAPDPRNPQNTVPYYPFMFPTDAILDQLTADETVTLFQAYTLVQNKYGPFAENIRSEEELNAWIRVLTEGARPHFLARKSLLQLAELAISLARRSYLLSSIIESLQRDSQSISAAQLATLGIGTSWFTGLQCKSTPDGLTLASSATGDEPDEAGELEAELQEALYGVEPGEAITLEQAVEVIKRNDEGL